jgi:excisionase family DNA binding protein
MTGTDPEPERANRMLKVTEAADRLSCSKGYVYLLMRRGELEYIEYPAASEGARLSGRRIPESAIAAFLDRYRVAAGGA